MNKNCGVSEELRQEAAEESEELERYIEELSTFLPLPFCTVNPSGVILNINQAFVGLTGYKDLEIIGEKVANLFDNEKQSQALERGIVKNGFVKGREMNLLTKNKDVVIANVSGALRKDREGNTIGYFLAFADINELKKLQRELEQKVEKRTKQLQEKVDEMEKFDRLTVGRELRMIELKEEIERLKQELNSCQKVDV